MKKHYFFILCTLIVLNMNAQITLTSASNAPVVGNSFDYFIIPSPILTFRQAGANKIWDFSSLSGSSETFNYVSLNNSSEPSTFPDANLVEVSNAGETYYSSSASELTLVGQLAPGIARLIFTDKREFMKFPITYNDVFTGTFDGTIENIPINQTFDRGGTIEIKADGYGDLILPYTTVKNVLRIRIAYDYSDKFLGNPLINYNDTIYLWYNASTKNFIANVSLSYANGLQMLYQATYISQGDLATGIEGLQANHPHISIYPNPADDFIVIENQQGNVRLEIYDIKGTLVMTEVLQNGTEQIQTTNLNPGIYLIQFVSKFNIFTKKLIVK